MHNFVNILYYFLLRPPTILFYIYVCIIKKYTERKQSLIFISPYIFKRFLRKNMISYVNASSPLFMYNINKFIIRFWYQIIIRILCSITLIFATNVIIKNLNKHITSLSIINKYYTEKLVSSLLILLYLYKLDNIMLLFLFPAQVAKISTFYYQILLASHFYQGKIIS